MQLNYDQKLKLVALTQQANHGTFSEENLPALGALDVIGKDRRSAWASLGDISKDESIKFSSMVRSYLPTSNYLDGNFSEMLII